jgi:hypothetical protein
MVELSLLINSGNRRYSRGEITLLIPSSTEPGHFLAASIKNPSRRICAIISGRDGSARITYRSGSGTWSNSSSPNACAVRRGRRIWTGYVWNFKKAHPEEP